VTIALVLALLVQQPASAAAFTKAAEAAETARKANSADAATLYAQALRLNPSWKEGWWALGTLHYQKDSYPECRDSFRRLVKLDPKNPAALSMLGLCEFRTKEYDSSLAHLRQGQVSGTGNESIDTVAQYHIAKLLAHGGDFESSLGTLLTLAQSGKEGPQYLMLAGTAGLWKTAFPEEIAPGDRELVLLAGRAFWEMARRRVAEGKAAFTQLVESYGTASGVHYLYGSFLLTEDPDKAVGEFEKELTVTPGHPGALTALAAEYLRRGDAAKGLPYAKRSVEVLPVSVASHTLLGRTLVESGDVEGGVKELEKAREMGPDEPQVRIGLASAYAKLGRTEDAARERREFVRLKALNKRPEER
jgi:Flp pilus assembly protein TadD